jgi:tetratricopeptide (TPR) repeat protein
MNLEIKKNDIWLCKKSYLDSFNELIEGDKDYHVLIVYGPEMINGESFVRIQPITYLTDNRSTEDILIENSELLGRPFIIETWNEQPIMTYVLDEYIGNITLDEICIKEQEDFSENQILFRKDELKETAYLRQSVLSYLSFLENKTDRKVIFYDFKLIVPIAASLLGIILLIWQPNKLSKVEFLEKYAVNYPSNFKSLIIGNENLRGEDCQLPNFNGYECESIQKALEKYDSKDYSSSVKYFESIKDLKKRSLELYFYYGLSLLFSEEKVEESINALTYLSLMKDISFKNDVLYYLSIAYSKNGNFIEARKVMKKLSTKDPSYKLMLKDMRWF